MPTIIVTGANRGIGLEFVRQYAADGAKVIAACREPGEAGELKAVAGDVSIHALDVTSGESMCAFLGAVDGPVDVLVANAGVGGPVAGTFGRFDYDAWRRMMDVNLYGAVATIEAFAPKLKQAKGKVAAISSKVGSIGDASGGSIAYRTSKTALNMAVKCLAYELAKDGVAVAPFHPGWVKTDMGGPNALITVEESVSGLRARIAEMSATPSPRFLDYAGEEIPW